MTFVELPTLTQMLWGLLLATQVALLGLLVWHGSYLRLRLFTLYVALNIVQGVFLAVIYPRWGFHSLLAWQTAWASQTLVIIARAGAMAELCALAISQFRGIWGLAWRVLLFSGLFILSVSIILGRHDFRVVVLTLDQGVELAIAAVCVGLFVFVKYYRLKMEKPLRLIGLGFCLYSCVFALNNALVVRLSSRYLEIWKHLNTLTFLGVVSLFIWAALSPMAVTTEKPVLLAAEVYGRVIPEIHQQLSALNDQLSRVWKRQSLHP